MAIRLEYGTARGKVCTILIFASIRAGWVRSTGLLPTLDPKA